MSMQWMARVWASREPAPANERLLLLALADSANEEGYCWPSMKTLAARCAVDARTARRNMRRLEDRRLVQREIRPGRSTMYRLLEREPAGSDSGVLPDTDEPGRVRPAGSDIRVRGGRAATPPITSREPESNPAKPVRADRPGKTGRERQERGPTDAGSSAHARITVLHPEGEQRALVHLLRERGVHEPVAHKLVRGHDAAAIRRYADAYDARCASGHEPRSPGWLVAAIQDGYLIEGHEDAARLYTHREAIDWLRRNRIELSPLNPFTRWFVPVRQPDGTARFRRLAPRQPLHT